MALKKQIFHSNFLKGFMLVVCFLAWIPVNGFSAEMPIPGCDDIETHLSIMNYVELNERLAKIISGKDRSVSIVQSIVDNIFGVVPFKGKQLVLDGNDVNDLRFLVSVFARGLMADLMQRTGVSSIRLNYDVESQGPKYLIFITGSYFGSVNVKGSSAQHMIYPDGTAKEALLRLFYWERYRPEFYGKFLELTGVSPTDFFVGNGRENVEEILFGLGYLFSPANKEFGSFLKSKPEESEGKVFARIVAAVKAAKNNGYRFVSGNSVTQQTDFRTGLLNREEFERTWAKYSSFETLSLSVRATIDGVNVRSDFQTLITQLEAEGFRYDESSGQYTR